MQGCTCRRCVGQVGCWDARALNPVECCLARDLKPENFLLSSKAEDAQLKGCDFGLSVFYQPGEVFQDIVGSAYYVAPEVRTATRVLWACVCP